MGSGNQAKLNSTRGRFTGTAVDANLVGVKVLGREGSGYVSNVIAGLNWCVTNENLYKIRIINLSLGIYPRESYRTDPLCGAVRRAVQDARAALG
jgi:serine protease AprX